jgi:hypothetical protein
MRQTLYIVVVAALLTGVVIDIVAAGVKTVIFTGRHPQAESE